MITFDFTQPYPSLTAVLFFFTGGLLLWVDVKGYGDRKMPREKRWARTLGWTNVSLGAVMSLAGIVYSQWFW